MKCQCCAAEAQAEAQANDPIVAICEKYRGAKGALIPVLQEAQKALGYLPEESMKTIAREMKVPVSRVYGIATFYTMFHLKPRGRKIIKVCLGTACHVLGATRVLEALEHNLGIKSGGTTEDLEFTLEAVSCLGACALGPVVVVDEQYFGAMTPAKVADMIKKTRDTAGEGE